MFELSYDEIDFVSGANDQNATDTAGGIMAGAVVGAAIGSVVPGIGTAVGALAGAATGAIHGLALSLLFDR